MTNLSHGNEELLARISQLEEENKNLRKSKKFGLVFENSIDELREELNSDNTDRSNHTDRSDSSDNSTQKPSPEPTKPPSAPTPTPTPTNPVETTPPADENEGTEMPGDATMIGQENG